LGIGADCDAAVGFGDGADFCGVAIGFGEGTVLEAMLADCSSSESDITITSFETDGVQLGSVSSSNMTIVGISCVGWALVWLGDAARDDVRGAGALLDTFDVAVKGTAGAGTGDEEEKEAVNELGITAEDVPGAVITEWSGASTEVIAC
jgi:hypothetical protein